MQVNLGSRPDSIRDPRRSGRVLPLEASIEPWESAMPGGWMVRLPVRAEHVKVETEVVVVEEVAVQRWQLQDDVQAEDTVQRELPRVATAGDLDTKRSVDPEAGPAKTERL
jgi:stress response protein YsnF